MDKLVDRLRGKYNIGPNAEFGKRDFSKFLPPIQLEAAERIEELESALKKVMEWNCLAEDVPPDVLEACEKALMEFSI